MTPALSVYLQLWFSTPLCWQSSKEDSSPLHCTSSRKKVTCRTSPNRERSVAASEWSERGNTLKHTMGCVLTEAFEDFISHTSYIRIYVHRLLRTSLTFYRCEPKHSAHHFSIIYIPLIITYWTPFFIDTHLHCSFCLSTSNQTNTTTVTCCMGIHHTAWKSCSQTLTCSPAKKREFRHKQCSRVAHISVWK